MGFFSKLFGRSSETDDQREEREYYEQNRSDNNNDVTFTVPTDCTSCFFVEDVFRITGRGTVAAGLVSKGSFSVGDAVLIESKNGRTEASILGVEQLRKLTTTVSEGANAGLLLSNINGDQPCQGDLIIKL